MTDNKMTPYLRNDFRIGSLTQIITAIDKSIRFLLNKSNKDPLYEETWLHEETEPLIGIAFIAFQNYINGSIKDFAETTSNKTYYYRIEQNFKGYQKSSIELIIGLANYSKHKEDEELHKGTQEILECFGLYSNNGNVTVELVFFEGLSILSEKWNLFDILKLVTNWREKLWTLKNGNTK